MDGQHLWVRIRFSSEKLAPLFAYLKDGWICIPTAPSRSLPLSKWESSWDALKCEIDVWHPATSLWKQVTTWKTLRALMQWEVKHAGTHLQKAAE
jgi:hypothetical protein